MFPLARMGGNAVGRRRELSEANPRPPFGTLLHPKNRIFAPAYSKCHSRGTLTWTLPRVAQLRQ